VFGLLGLLPLTVVCRFCICVIYTSRDAAADEDDEVFTETENSHCLVLDTRQQVQLTIALLRRDSVLPASGPAVTPIPPSTSDLQPSLSPTPGPDGVLHSSITSFQWRRPSLLISSLTCARRPSAAPTFGLTVISFVCHLYSLPSTRRRPNSATRLSNLCSSAPRHRRRPHLISSVRSRVPPPVAAAARSVGRLMEK